MDKILVNLVKKSNFLLAGCYLKNKLNKKGRKLC